ncbi:unnamed protein product [Paramecium sonneborni]|uniref:Thioredoxin domain-containing protein n=1 Tax=Paramecium sonneborni TaxID=65129 RepID=A0A8S1QUR4_9CILI|nr:unnamed protein product [Paramecium sonneborni]
MIIVLLLLLIDVNADWYHSTLAFTLAANNYQQHLGKEKHVVLDFFTPWCIYCQHMAGEFNQVFEHYQETRPDILIAKMNCDEQQNQHICHHFGVHSFPTILYFPPGQDRPTSQFQNHRRYDFFVQWIDSLAQMSEETKQEIQQQKLEKMLKEQEEQELRLKEMMELERQKQIEQEEHQKQKEEEIRISQSIQQQITEANTYIDTIKGMEKEIYNLQQQTAELNSKLVQIKKLPKVNINHALVFAIIGFFFGITMTSCVCLYQKTSHVNTEKGI